MFLEFFGAVSGALASKLFYQVISDIYIYISCEQEFYFLSLLKAYKEIMLKGTLMYYGILR